MFQRIKCFFGLGNAPPTPNQSFYPQTIYMGCPRSPPTVNAVPFRYKSSMCAKFDDESLVNIAARISFRIWHRSFTHNHMGFAVAVLFFSSTMFERIKRFFGFGNPSQPYVQPPYPHPHNNTYGPPPGHPYCAWKPAVIHGR